MTLTYLDIAFLSALALVVAVPMWRLATKLWRCGDEPRCLECGCRLEEYCAECSADLPRW